MINLRELTEEGCSVALKDVNSSSPYCHALEYNAPARGVWNIVHIGMLLPESHQVFVCPPSCMRGVVLTAAEMNALDRFSSLFLTESDLLSGDCENLIIDGVTQLIGSLPVRPKALLLYTNCQDQFMGVDHTVVYGELRSRFPDINFVECFMCPTMRKSTLPPDLVMRRQLYSLLQPTAEKRRSVNFIGNNIPLPRDNEFIRMLTDGGYEVFDIGNCKTFAQYQNMSKSVLNIMVNPAGNAAVDSLTERLGQKALKIPVSYDFFEIEDDLHKFAGALRLDMPDVEPLKKQAEEWISRAAERVGNMPVSLDYTATSRPFGLAKLLTEHGFHVVSIYADVCSEADFQALNWLKENAGDIQWKFPYHHKMAVLPRGPEKKENLLAIGQEAAYFTGTKHFVNIVENDGLYGFHGICRLMELISDAAAHEKDTRRLIQVKGLGIQCGKFSRPEKAACRLPQNSVKT